MNTRKENPPVRQPSLTIPIVLAAISLTALTGSAITLTGLLIGHL